MNNTQNLAVPGNINELRNFRAGLSLFDMRLILDQAIFMIDRLYVHLIMKKAIHGIDPVSQLKRLLDRMTHQPDELTFNNQMNLIFAGLRDLHTQYLQPAPIKQTSVYLPFVIERYFANERWHFIVTHTKEDFGYAFQTGVEVTHFNGVPIEQAILNNAATSGGSNPAAFFASGLYSLTNRWLAHAPIPDADWIVVTYIAHGKQRHIRIPWRILPPPVEAAPPSPSFGKSINEHHLKIQSFQKSFYGKDKIAKTTTAQHQTKFPDQLQFGTKKTPHGEFGWLRIFNFEPSDNRAFIQEVARIVKLLPTAGLIIDIRGNPGGIIPVGESILQFFSDQAILPEPLHFRATQETLALTQADEKLARWAPSIDEAMDTGEIYSAGFPLTPQNWLTQYGRIYPGKVVLITDALVYSTASFFTAGFRDNDLGLIIGLDNNIGGGGANLWSHNDIAAVYPRTRISNPFENMPAGTNINLALLQSSRVGKEANQPVSELGVTPDYRYFTSRRDLEEDFAGLFNFAGKVLAGK